MKTKLIIVFIILSQSIIAQIAQVSHGNSGYFSAKEFSKEISLYRAKQFLIEEVLKTENKVIQFDLDPLAATNSGELTSLGYKCEEKGEEGILLGFYGSYWNAAGVVYQGYRFKNLSRDMALELLNKITKTIKDSNDFLSKNPDNNNVYFKFDDLVVLIYTPISEPIIRVFWEDFDAEWTSTAFKRTKKRYEKSLK